LIGVSIGLRIFVRTLIFAWTDRADATSQRATKASALITLSAGLSGLLYWMVFEEEPFYSLETFVVLMLSVAPAFAISFFAFWLRFRRSIDSNSKSRRRFR
jgi:hypothetical protein